MDPIEHGPSDADRTVIMLHGFGDQGARFIGDTFTMLLKIEGLRLLLPQGPQETLQGQQLQTWFVPINGQWIIDDVVAKPIVGYVHAMVRREIARGVPPNRIVIGGFAQGGSLALRAALSFPDAPIGGALALSAFFGAASAVVAPANKGLHALVCHGRGDETVPFTEGERTVEQLRRLVQREDSVTFKEYDMKHGVASDELMDVFEFINSRLDVPDEPIQEKSAPDDEPLTFDPVKLSTAPPPAKGSFQRKPRPAQPGASSGADAPPKGIPSMEPSLVMQLLNDPDIANAAKDPEGMAVIQDVIMDPSNLEKHKGNPRVEVLVEKLIEKLGI
ncbi:unnamed protein product [Polarella glacialis]|uniref:Phospholipase/carboxylesterase/thioesterase domain-containing protein n=1 Tax=Polarella glacialis TaxID=89957 RepID=A0A813IIE2_POLGL|nr:unnamed protein product [Polarella glacialis]